jgi:hypothetical protein
MPQLKMTGHAVELRSKKLNSWFENAEILLFPDIHGYGDYHLWWLDTTHFLSKVRLVVVHDKWSQRRKVET